jgi:citrate synthase
VKPATLYSYVSRGRIRAFPGERHRERRYLQADLERLRRRADARLGHEAVASGALRWGEPVLSSAITELRADGPWYRGHSAAALARTERFESVATLLWNGTLPALPVHWPRTSLLLPPNVRREMGRMEDPLGVLLAGLTWLRSQERARAVPDGGPPRLLVQQLLGLTALACRTSPEAALAERSVAAGLLRAMGLPPRRGALRAVNAALVLSADHELNVSSFAARVAASTGADLPACLVAALATFTGPRHGAESARVQALLLETGGPSRARPTLLARLRRGEGLPGFAHPLYRDGDPRARVLLEHARRLGGRRPRPMLATALALTEQAERLGLDGPTLDLGALALAHALGAPPVGASLLFCVGRSAGWVAHVQEQRASGELLRPRARYVGPRG